MIELNKRFLPFYLKKARYKIAKGGRAGSKSHNVATCLLIKALQTKKRVVCLREYQKNLQESVYQLLCDKIRSDSVMSHEATGYRIMSDRIIGYNGSEFSFSGIKNAENFKSFEGADVAWVEEAQTISAESLRILIPTIRKPGSEIWFTYNPENEDDPVHLLANKPFLLTPEYLLKQGFDEETIAGLIQSYDEGQITLTINYLDNPHCPSIMKVEANQLKKADPELYRHIWMGDTRIASDAIIFKDKWQELDFELENYFGIPKFNGEIVNLNYGLDFGWVHPTVLIEAFRYRGNIYVSNEMMGKDLDLDMVTMRALEEVPFCANNVIYGDCAQPLMINQLCTPRYSKNGAKLPPLSVQPSVKGHDSVKAGINWLKTHEKIFVHPRCQYLINNFKKYSYKLDKNGIISTEIIKLNDDGIDALRYAFSDLISQGVSSLDWNDPEFLREINQM
jgi:phage terminase large subunit